MKLILNNECFLSMTAHNKLNLLLVLQVKLFSNFHPGFTESLFLTAHNHRD